MNKLTVENTELLNKAGEYLPEDKVALVERAYQRADRAHQGQYRKSGEPYVVHPLQAALLLAELQLDANSLAAALLHDVPEDSGVPLSEIEAEFGTEIAKLVDGTTKFGKLTRTGEGASGSHWIPGASRRSAAGRQRAQPEPLRPSSSLFGSPPATKNDSERLLLSSEKALRSDSAPR